MTLPIIVLIAIVAGVAAAGAAWFFLDRRAHSPAGANRFVLPGAAFLVLAAIVGGALFALARDSASEPERKVLEAIQRHHPEAATEITAIRRETNPALAQKRASDLAQRYLPRHIPTTSDAAVLRFTSETTKLFEKLVQRDPENCKALATGGATSAAFDPAAMRPALDAMAQVVDDSVDQPQPPPQQQRAQQLLAGVVERVYARQPNDLAPPQLLTQPATVPAPQLCRTMVAFYREILNLPPADASQVLRTLMRGGQQPRG